MSQEQKKISKLKAENQALRARIAKLENHPPCEMASLEQENQVLRTSEEKYRLLMEHLGVPATVFNVKGELILLNEPAAIRLGGKKEELLGKNLSQLLGKKIGAKAHERLKRIIKTGLPLEHEDRVVDSSGVRWSWTIQTPVKDSNGKTVAIQVISHDITERKESEATIQSNEKKLRVAQQFAKIGSWERDLVSNVTTCSDELYRIYGYEPGGFEPSFEFFRNKVHPNDLAVFDAAVEKASDRSGGFDCKFRITLPNATIRHIHSRGDIYLDKSSNPLRSFGVTQDITEQTELEENLKKSEEQIRAVFESTSDCILVWDKDYNYLYANQAAIDHVGTTREKVIGKNIRDGLGHIPEFMKLWMNRVDRIFETGKSFRVEDSMDLGETIVFSESIISPIKTLSGEVTAAAVVYRDLTERKKSEEALRKSERRHRNLFEFAGDALIICDSEGKILDVNHIACEMHHYIKKDFLKLNCKDIIHPDYHEIYEKALDAVLTRKTFSAELKHIDSEGKSIPVEASISPSQYEGIKAGLVSIRDITRRKEAELALQESQERYKLLSDVATEGVVIHESGMIVEANKNFCDMFGYSLEELKNQNSLVLISPNHRKVVQEGMGQEHIGPYETLGLRKDGSEFPITIQARGLKRSGRVLRVGSIRDISVEKQMENELEDYRDKILQSQRHAYINSTGAIVAHQLNQPLTIINMLLGQIKDDIRKGKFGLPKVVEQIDDCLSEASNAAGIMSKFRQSVRTPSWERFEYVHVHTITEKMISALQKRAEHAMLDITLKGLEKLPKITINENALEQIVFILTQNSIEAADDKKPHNLLIEGKYKNDKVELIFKDDCGGMTEDNAKQIFEPFFTTKSNKQGMGLGLEIVHRILLTCGGKIKLKNEPGVGVEFIIKLPVEARERQEQNGS